MRRAMIFMVLSALFYAVPAKAQDSLTLAIANKQLTAEKTDLQSQVASLEIRLEMAQARIAELEKANAKPQQPVVVTIQPDPSTVRANNELAQNLRLQRALAISNAFKAPAPQVQMPLAPAVQCTSQTVGVTVQTVCK